MEVTGYMLVEGVNDGSATECAKSQFGRHTALSSA